MIKWTVQQGDIYVPLQFDLRASPWQVLMACTLLRQTGGHTVKPVLEQFFERWPTPMYLVSSPLVDIVEAIRPCGIHNTKARAIISITYEYLKYQHLNLKTPTAWAMTEWDSVGPYALQSVALFCDRTDLIIGYFGEVKDHVLTDFVASPLYRKFLETGDIA